MDRRPPRLTRNVRLLCLELAVPLLMVVAAEVGVRAWLRHTPAPPLPHLFSSPIDTGKHLALERRVAAGDPPDLLLLGMSPMMRIDGSALAARLEASGRAARPFSLAGPYRTLELDRRLLDAVLLPDTRPRVLVYGVTPLTLLNERPAASIDRIVAEMPVFQARSRSPAQWIAGRLVLHSRLIGHRETIQRALTPGPETDTDAWADLARQTDGYGDIALVEQTFQVRGLTQQNQMHQRRLKRFDHLLRDAAPLITNLRALAALCRREGIALVIAVNAVHPLFADVLPAGRADYERFVRRLREVAVEEQAWFFDPAQGGFGPPELFNDLVHLNPTGGRWMTEALADFLIENGLLDAPPVEE